MRSHTIPALVSVVALSAATQFLGPQPAYAEEPEVHSVTLQLYGALTPRSAGYGSNSRGEMWAYGGAVQWGLAEHWAVSIDASRFAAGRSSITPFVGGLIYRPITSAKVRPWLEFGAGSYRYVEPRSSLRVIALGSSGDLRDQFFQGPNIAPRSRADVGGFIGAGVDAMFSRSLGLGIGVRIHNWRESRSERVVSGWHEVTNWSGMLALRTGLSYRF